MRRREDDTPFATMQAVALAHPCLLAQETAHPRYARTLVGARGPFASLIVTINVGYE
jgi:hypothetical protein